MGDQVARLAEPAALESLVAAARRLARSRWVYCLGLRSSHPAAWQLHYILSLIGERTVLLDSSAGTGADAIGPAQAQDTLLAVSVAPYTRHTRSEESRGGEACIRTGRTRVVPGE